MSTDSDTLAVEHFKEYLRIPSVQPDVDYDACVEFLKRRAQDLGLAVAVELVAPKKPVVVMSWVGSQTQLPSLLLSSHMDVVPVYEDQWTRPPFGAEEDEDGNIYARGTQDMKCVAIQYLEAIGRLISQGFRPKRTVHLCFTPDEEIGLQGMRRFVQTDTFKQLNVGCAFDEGIASSDESFTLFNGDRTPYSLSIICSGTPGHGSLLLENTAGEQLAVVTKRFMERRAEEKKKLKSNPSFTIGDVDTINLTMIKGGVQSNVIPPEINVRFDCRLSTSTDFEEFDKWVRNVCAEAGDGVRVESVGTLAGGAPTKLDPSNPWWTALKSQFDQMGLNVNCVIFPANSDARCIRALGIPAFGFSPMNNTPVLLHDHNEFLNRKIFLKGVEIYVNIISALADV